MTALVVIIFFAVYFFASLFLCSIIRFKNKPYKSLMNSGWDGRVQWKDLRWMFLEGNLNPLPMFILFPGGIVIEIFNLITDRLLENKWREYPDSGYHCDFSEKEKINDENGKEKEL